MSEIEAVAEAWASIDGKLDGFRRDQELTDWDHPDYTGHYDGYMAEARELIQRIEKRGFILVKKPE